MAESGGKRQDGLEHPAVVTTTQPTSSYQPPPLYTPQSAPWPPPHQVAPVAQQMSHVNNIIITGQIGAPVGPPLKRDWSSGLCDCFSDMETCLMAFFCASCLQCRLAQDLGDSCCDAYCFCQCAPAHFGLRTYMRGKENIKGSLFDDFNRTMGICSICFAPCALAQLAREVKHVKSVKGYV